MQHIYHYWYYLLLYSAHGAHDVLLSAGGPYLATEEHMLHLECELFSQGINILDHRGTIGWKRLSEPVDTGVFATLIRGRSRPVSQSGHFINSTYFSLSVNATTFSSGYYYCFYSDIYTTWSSNITKVTIQS